MAYNFQVVWYISSQATITYHCWGLLCVRTMPLEKYVDRLQGGAECESQQFPLMTGRLSLTYGNEEHSPPVDQLSSAKGEPCRLRNVPLSCGEQTPLAIEA
jgi:hypothetical protein